MAERVDFWNGRNGNGDNGADSGVTFTNVRILDGTGERPYTGEVTIQGNRIQRVSRSGAGGGNYQWGSGGGGQRIDGRGATLMPGLIDAHLHLSWTDAPGLDPMWMMPPEEHILSTIEMGKVVLDAGFTAGRGAAAAKPRLDVVARDAMAAGRFPGPRYTAAGPEITTIGGLADSCPPHVVHEGMNIGIVVTGPEEMRRTVRELLKYGVDTIKLNLSGEELIAARAEETPMSEEEIAMAVNEVRRRGRTLAAHARSAESIKLCVKYGIEFIYHASFADNEALDMLEANKEKHFVAPGLAFLINIARNAAEWGIKPGDPVSLLYERELEHAVETMKEMHRRGIRVLIGGDYGFAWTPMGTNAKDLEYFVDMIGMSPMEALQAGTRYGGEIMGMGDELGLVREGYLADLLLVDGDPSVDVRVLQDKSRLLAIMQDGRFHKAPENGAMPMRLTA